MAMVVGAAVKAGITLGVFAYAWVKHHKNGSKTHRTSNRGDDPDECSSIDEDADKDIEETLKKHLKDRKQTKHQHRPPILAGPRPVMGDLNALETVLNIVTCGAYFWMARAGHPIGASLWSRLFSLSSYFTGASAMVYHISKGHQRHFWRRLDYIAVATSAVSLTCARVKPRPLFMAGISLALAPFQPLVVAGAHIFATEVAFLKRALEDASMRQKHMQHTGLSFLAFAAFYSDDMLPQVPYLHAAWHVFSAGATHLACCLIEP